MYVRHDSGVIFVAMTHVDRQAVLQMTCMLISISMASAVVDSLAKYTSESAHQDPHNVDHDLGLKHCVVRALHLCLPLNAPPPVF